MGSAVTVEAHIEPNGAGGSFEKGRPVRMKLSVVKQSAAALPLRWLLLVSDAEEKLLVACSL